MASHSPLRVFALSIIALAPACLEWDALQQGRCGDGFVGPEERCDDGNVASGDGCSARCEPEPAPEPEIDAGPPPPPGPACGDGQLDEDEVCDDGNGSNADACLNGCSRATCGDGFTRAQVEECDVAAVAGFPCTPACLACGPEPEAFYRGANRHCFTRHPEPRTHAEARSICQDEGGDLWTVTSQDEGDAAVTRLALSGAHWLGLRVAGETRSWVTGEAVTFQNFASAQPGTAACVALAADGAANAWSSSGCAMRLPFVCERAAALVDFASSHAYRVYTRAVTAAQARERCAATGGALASIETEAERVFLSGKLNLPVWVAAHEVGDGAFEWATGGAVDAALFRPGQPDDAADANGCLVLEPKRRLADQPCTELAAYVCEHE